MERERVFFFGFELLSEKKKEREINTHRQEQSQNDNENNDNLFIYLPGFKKRGRRIRILFLSELYSVSIGLKFANILLLLSLSFLIHLDH